MQLVGRHKINMNFFPYTMLQFLSELLQRLCLATHQNGCDCFALVNVANTDLLHSYHWERCAVVLCVFVNVQFIFHFLLLASNCKCKASMCKSTCFCFFTRTKQPHTSQQSAATGPCATATFKAESQHLLAIQMANTRPVQ